jgi:NTP pyrophosphatase (non-canonical NTP hydrolase)
MEITAMTDDVMRIKELKEKARDFVDERDWSKYHHPKELAISMAIEVAELLEIFQWDEKADIQDIKNNEQTMSKIKEEVADIMMYILCFSDQLDLDLSEAILTKLEKNRRKYDKNAVLKTGAYRKDKL